MGSDHNKVSLHFHNLIKLKETLKDLSKEQQLQISISLSKETWNLRWCIKAINQRLSKTSSRIWWKSNIINIKIKCCLFLSNPPINKSMWWTVTPDIKLHSNKSLIQVSFPLLVIRLIRTQKCPPTLWTRYLPPQAWDVYSEPRLLLITIRAWDKAKFSISPLFRGLQEILLVLAVILSKSRKNIISLVDQVIHPTQDILILFFSMVSRKSNCCSLSKAFLNLRYISQPWMGQYTKVNPLRVKRELDLLFQIKID